MLPIASDNLPINNRIRAARVFLIDEQGTAIGEVTTASALSRAAERELDLVLVGPQANPPVAKILDYGKYKYELDRKARKNKAKKTQEIKEIRLSYNTDEHDIEVKLNQAKRFLSEGHKIKLRLKLVGREMAFKEKAVEQLNRFRDLLGLEYEQPVQRQGKQMSVLLKEKKS
ncbi:translation initiation factor IF-3 [Patescibacteria group bacterium]|nr:translation initiation factor IF-3 [Patescibacteria group bacterium]